jgi:hypothetical protein
MRGSLEHDAFYQLMRFGLLPLSFRKEVDQRLYTVCVQDGMSRIRASWVKFAVNTFAERCAVPQEDKTYIAP